MKIKNLALALVASLALFSASASAITIGVISDNGAAETAGIAAAGALGHTGVSIATVDAASLAGIDMLWAMNQSNSNQLAAVNANADLAAWVAAGGKFLYHDRRVTDAGDVLPGAGGTTFTRSLTSTINVEDGSTSLTNGPGGIIDDSTLDGGNSSNHGFSASGTLPAGAVAILNNGTPGNIVDWTYFFGAGAVHYSTIPLDFYIDGGGANGDAFRNIYTPNVLNYVANLGGGRQVPEPASLALLGLGLAGLGAGRRRRAA